MHPRRLERGLTTLDTGWFAKRDRFDYSRNEQPQFAPGGDAWLEATPPVLSAFQPQAGLEFTLSIGVERLRANSLAQQSLVVAELAAQGVAAAGGNRHQAAVLAAKLKDAGIDTDAKLRRGSRPGSNCS